MATARFELGITDRQIVQPGRALLVTGLLGSAMVLMSYSRSLVS